MLIEIERQNEVCILRIKGRFASGTDPDYLRSKAEEIKAQACSKILVDLGELDSIGSMGLGFVVGVYVSVIKNPAGRFVLAGLNSRVREVFELTRLDTLLPMAANLEAGMKVLRGEGPAERSLTISPSGPG